MKKIIKFLKTAELDDIAEAYWEAWHSLPKKCSWELFIQEYEFNRECEDVLDVRFGEDETDEAFAASKRRKK